MSQRWSDRRLRFVREEGSVCDRLDIGGNEVVVFVCQINEA